jgi:hypothetical protein
MHGCTTVLLPNWALACLHFNSLHVADLPTGPHINPPSTAALCSALWLSRFCGYWCGPLFLYLSKSLTVWVCQRRFWGCPGSHDASVLLRSSAATSCEGSGLGWPAAVRRGGSCVAVELGWHAGLRAWVRRNDPLHRFCASGLAPDKLLAGEGVRAASNVQPVLCRLTVPDRYTLP